MMRRQNSRVSAWLVAAATVAAVLFADLPEVGISTAAAQQNVTIAPTRVVFEEGDRTQELVLFNRGGESVTYRVSLIGMKMTDEGSLERIEEPEEGQQFAHELLRFAPRQVQLEPGQSQRVRVSARKPPELEAGEYRSHMLFQAVPESADQQEVDVEGQDQLALQLNIISGISIPAIVRHGDLSVDLTVDNLEFAEGTDGQKEGEEQTPDRVRFDLRRDGDRSVYGEITVEFVPDQAPEEDEQPEPIAMGRLNGAAVYTPNEVRHVEIPVQRPEEYSLDEGRILVTYEEDTGDTRATGELNVE